MTESEVNVIYNQNKPPVETTPTQAVESVGAPLIFPRCGGFENYGCPDKFICDYGNGRLTKEKPGEIGFCASTLTGVTSTTQDLITTPTPTPVEPQPTIQPEIEPTPILFGQVIVFGEEVIVDSTKFKIEKDSLDANKVIVTVNGVVSISMGAGETKTVNGYKITLNSILSNGIDITIIKTDEASDIPLPQTIDDYIPLLRQAGVYLSEDQAVDLAGLQLVLSLLSFVSG